jgi:precorrin-2 dehydrogenase / sirohydrochlorin ferrochelatase
MAENLFPIFVQLARRPCLVVGAGAVAESKIQSLLEAGADVTVVAPCASNEVQRLFSSERIRWSARIFLPGDLEGIFLVIAATGDPRLNRLVFLESQRRGILCNSVDDPPHCDFYFPSIVRRGDLQIAISTAGESPAFAQRLRIELEQSLDAHLGQWISEIGDWRRKILASEPPSEARKSLLRSLASDASWEKWKLRNTLPAQTAAAKGKEPLVSR